MDNFGAMLVQKPNSCGYWILLKRITIKINVVVFPNEHSLAMSPVAVQIMSKEKNVSHEKRRSPCEVWPRTCLAPPPLSTAGASSCSCQIPPHNQQASCGESAKEWCGVRERCRLGGRGIPCSWRVIWEKDDAARVWALCWSGIGYWDILQKVQKRKRMKYERGNHLPQLGA